MGDLWNKITSPFKKPIQKVEDYFAPAPQVRVRDVVRELPKATVDTFQKMGQASWRGFAAVASLLTGKPFVPEGEFQKELYGTDKPITVTSFGRESRGADPEGKSEGIFKVIDPTLGLFFGAADAIPGGQEVKQDVKQGAKAIPKVLEAAEETVPKAFKGFKDISTKVLDTLKGKAQVSKQFISDLTKTDGLKQAERTLLNEVLQDMPDKVPVQKFADQVKTRLLPLKSKVTDDIGDVGGAVFNSRDLGEMSAEGVNPPRYQHISLPEEEKGEVSKYLERIYESPVKTSGGDVHFSKLPEGVEYPNYFAHSRAEDLADNQTRRVIELQSDLFQRGRLEQELNPYMPRNEEQIKEIRDNVVPEIRKMIEDGKKPEDILKRAKEYGLDDTEFREKLFNNPAEAKNDFLLDSSFWDKELAKVKDFSARSGQAREQLTPYKNTWWERVIREEVKQAAKDGKTTLQFPTGETALKIEGLAGSHDQPWAYRGRPVASGELKVGMELENVLQDEEKYVVTEVLGNGRFKAEPVEMNERRAIVKRLEAGEDVSTLPKEFQYEISGAGGRRQWLEVQSRLGNREETYDVSGTVDSDNPIFKFYEKNVQTYLKKYGGKVVTDDKGVTWVQIDVPKGAGKAPVQAFGFAAGIEEEDDGTGKKKLKIDPLKAALGIGIMGGIKGLPEDLPKRIADALKPISEIESLDILARQETGARFALRGSPNEEEKLISNLDSIFADLKGVSVEDLKTSFTPEDLEQAKAHYDIATEMLLDNPARQLSKYANKRTGELPEVLGKGTSIFGRKGDSIVTELGFEDSEQARAAYQTYLAQKEALTRVQANLGRIRAEIRLAKQRDLFIGDAKNTIARQVAKDVKSLRNLVESAERAGYKRGLSEGSEKLKQMIARLKDRRSKINAIKHAFNLDDLQMKKIRGAADPRFMDADEFNTWFKELERKAIEAEKWMNEKVIVDAIIKEKELNKTDNLRVALKLPQIKEMSLEQLFQFDEALSQFKRGDTFLGPRMIQTIANTDIGPVKTVREIRDSLAKQVGVDNLALTNVAGKWGDKFLYDPALAEENPLYKYMVTAWTAKKIEADQKVLLLKEQIDELAFAARKSRKRSFADILVPQDKMVFDYLEAPTEEKELAKQRMTGPEIKFAEFVEGLFRGYRDTLLEKGTLKRYRKNYITHTSRSFFERWKDDGFVSAIKTYWESLVEQRVDFEAIGETGEVLGLEKFFKYALQREGGMVPSKNVARAVMTYARTFEKKQALDQIIPKVDAYTFSLQRSTKIKDPTGLNVDGRLRRFVREWLNNKKGRRVEFVVSQGGKMDARLRALKLFLSIKDLGFNIITGLASAGGAEVSNFVGLTTKNYAKGISRALTSRGRILAVKYNGVVGERTFENVISASNDIGDTFQSGAFAILQDIAYRAKRQFFLGSLTNEEWKTGNVTTQRLAQIKLNMAKFHPLEDMKSVIGSTPEAQFVGMYKSWAVPFLMTARSNAKKTMQAFKDAEGLTGKAAVLKTEEARQLMKLTVGALGIYTFFHTIFEDDEKDDGTFTGKLKQRFLTDTASSLSAMNPTTWLTIRPLEFMQELAEGMDLLIKLEEYKTSGNGYKKGDLKGVKKIESTLMPAAIRQFTDTPTVGKMLGGNQTRTHTTSGGSSGRLDANQLLNMSQ